jgi:hypothetical protein
LSIAGGSFIESPQVAEYLRVWKRIETKDKLGQQITAEAEVFSVETAYRFCVFTAEQGHSQPATD